MIEEPYKNLFCDKCKYKIVVNGKDRCDESTNPFTMKNHCCYLITRCIHFEEDKIKTIN